MGIIDFMAKKVQDFSGETERRELVQEFKCAYQEHRRKLNEIIEKVNVKISNFNNKIQQINVFRQEKVIKNIYQLGNFLKYFGHLDLSSQFILESEKDKEILPQKKLDKISNYIDEVDWSRDDVFLKTFSKTIIGVKLETRKMNLSMRDNLNHFRLSATHTENMLESKGESIEIDIRIADLYEENIKTIDQVITKKVIPELELIEAFMQAEAIKNNILVNNNDIDLTTNHDFSLLKGTVYDKHYQFIKNTFMFYIISKKIYNTPILTNLLSDSATRDDLKNILNEKEVLNIQQESLSNQMIKR